MTITQLLNHTFGIPRDFPAAYDRSRPIAADSIIALPVLDTLIFPSGTKWSYSNVGYFVLGMLAEKLFARPYGEIVQEELARPLGLTATQICGAPGVNGLAVGYSRLPGSAKLRRVPDVHTSRTFSAGALCSTVGDLAMWNRALHTGKVLSDESYRQMITPQGAAIEGNYGFGLFSLALQDLLFLEHSGDVGGYHAENFWFPADSLSVVILENSRSTRGGSVTRIPRAVFGFPQINENAVADVAVVPPMDSAMLAPYSGRYTIQIPGRPLVMSIRVDANELLAQAEGQGEFVLRSIGEHRFEAAMDASIKLVFAVKDGVATEMTFEQNGRRFQGLKGKGQ